MGRSKLTKANVTGIINFEWKDRRGLKHGTLVVWALAALLNFGIFFGAVALLVYSTVNAVQEGLGYGNAAGIVIGGLVVLAGLTNGKGK